MSVTETANTVVDRVSEIQTGEQGRVPRPKPFPPLPDSEETAGEEGGVCAKTLDELKRPVTNDGQELLRNRFLCKGGGLLLVGPTGVGKSSLAMQMMIGWALGRSQFGIEPARPMKSLLIQAENDEGDEAEMRDGVFSGLNVSEADRSLACSRIFVAQENTRTSEEFFQDTVRPMLEQIKPDLLWIDPALAYLGGENNSQQAVGAFLRNGLNPLLTEFNCGAVVIHHTNKPYSGPDKRGPVDHAYLGGGSAEWSNWSRAILTLQKTDNATIFELRAAKRGNRLGWKEADKTTTAFNRFIAHNKEPGTICWLDVDPGLAEGLGCGVAKSGDDVLKHVPLDRPIAKNRLIELCGRDGIGENATRGLIDDLVKQGRLCEWKKPRPGTQPEKHLARIAQPVGPDGKEMFTEMFTANLAHENLHENHRERCSHLHPPLGGVNMSREHLEHPCERQEGVALLPVAESNAAENQCREDGPPPPPACFRDRQPEPSSGSKPSASLLPPLPDTQPAAKSTVSQSQIHTNRKAQTV